MVIDGLASRYSEGRERCDRDGARAAVGRPDLELLAGLMRDPYYRAAPPKSAGREQYGDEFVAGLAQRGLSPEDTLATATLLTAATIADAICAAAGDDGEGVDEVIVSGGGVHNATLMRYLRAELPGAAVLSSAGRGIDPDGKEAIAFAVLAHESWHGRPANLPSATGARHPVVLGRTRPGQMPNSPE
jgi:anhydro-N-acetylmuramic acid kinase